MKRGVHKSIPFNPPPMFEMSPTEVEILLLAIENLLVASRSSAFAHSSMRLPAGLDVTLV
jgi:hypothetical protein